MKNAFGGDEPRLNPSRHSVINMAIRKVSGRQYMLTARIGVRAGDLEDGVESPAIDIPAGTVIEFGNINVITPFTGGVGDDELAVGDSDEFERYSSSGPADLTTVGILQLEPTGLKYLNDDTIFLFYRSSSIPTDGYAEVTLFYTVEGRAHEAQHDNR